jgi:hypothetical protein
LRGGKSCGAAGSDVPAQRAERIRLAGLDALLNTRRALRYYRLLALGDDMTAPQFIRTPQGEELVVLPRADYDALVARAESYDEDADDVAIYDARMADLAGREPSPPPVPAAKGK